jgi:hypothetical protein
MGRRRRSKNNVSVIIFIAVLCLPVLGLVRPSSPPQWDKIKRGMNRAQVRQHVPSGLKDMRYSKGYDTAVAKHRQWGFRRCYWQLRVAYDRNLLVESVQISFTDPNCGLYNIKWHENLTRMRE